MVSSTLDVKQLAPRTDSGRASVMPQRFDRIDPRGSEGRV